MKRTFVDDLILCTIVVFSSWAGGEIALHKFTENYSVIIVQKKDSDYLLNQDTQQGCAYSKACKKNDKKKTDTNTSRETSR